MKKKANKNSPKGVVVFDASGIPIYTKLTSKKVPAISLIAALLGIAAEMGLGDVEIIHFQQSYVFLLSGIKNPTLVVAIFSDRPVTIKNLIIGCYLVKKIDDAIQMQPGFITEDVREKIKTLVDKYYTNLDKIVSDFFTPPFINSLKDFGPALETVYLSSLLTHLDRNIFEYLIVNPVDAIKKLRKILGDGGTEQVLLSTFRKLEKNLNIKISRELIKKLLSSTKYKESIEIVRALIEEIIDNIILNRGVIDYESAN